MEFEVTALIECHVSQAFEACDSAKDQIAWMGSLVEVEILPETPWGIGARFRQIHEEAGVRQEFEGVLLDYQVNQRIEFQLTHSDFTVHTELLFEDLGERSRVTQRSSFELHSLALRLAKGMIQGVIATRFQDDMDRLKALVEASA